jgi:hypothetical protein
VFTLHWRDRLAVLASDFFVNGLPMPSSRGFWRLPALCGFVAACVLAACSRESIAQIKTELGQSVAHVSPGNLAVYRPEKWGHVTLHLQNPSDQPLELLTTTFFEHEPTLQYGRRVWVPPRSQMHVWQPLRLPREGGGSSLNLRTLVMEAGQSREVLLRSDIGFRQLDSTVRIMDDAVTGVVEAPIPLPAEGTLFPEEDTDAVSQLIATARLEAQLTKRVAELLEQSLPASEEAYQALDHLVLADNRVADDAAALAAIRRWLFGGGRLWVMLDKVEPRMLDRLLGDEFVGEVVDRVGLTTVRISDPQDRPQLRSVQEHERPIEFVRVAVSNVEVAYTVDGWPAAFWKTCGEGRLLVSTLGARGWMRPRVAADNAAFFGGGEAKIVTFPLR